MNNTLCNLKKNAYTLTQTRIDEIVNICLKEAQETATEIKLISPKEAENILTNHNKNNRDFKAIAIKRFAKQMVNGEWHISTLYFDKKTGNLLDGQNRLAAVIKSSTSQTFIVIRTPVEDYKKCLNTGTATNNRDRTRMFLYQLGYSYQNMWSVLCKAYAYENQLRHKDATLSTEVQSILDFEKENHDLLLEISDRKDGFVRNIVLLKSMEYILRKHFGKVAEEFFGKIERCDTTEDNVLKALLKFMIKDCHAKSHDSNNQEVAIMIAFDAYRKNLKWGIRQEINPYENKMKIVNCKGEFDRDTFEEAKKSRDLFKKDFFVVNYLEKEGFYNK